MKRKSTKTLDFRDRLVGEKSDKSLGRSPWSWWCDECHP